MSRARSKARERAVQAIYQWQVTGQSLSDIEQQFTEDQDMSKVKMEYFQELLHEVPAQLKAIDAALAELVDRPLEQVDPVERAILRIGTYELQARQDIPYRVVINESVELAKSFGSEQGHTYINGILDKLAKKLRAIEVQAQRAP